MAHTDGKHALMCPKIRHRFTRHTNCNLHIQEAIKTAGYPSSLEPVGLLRCTSRLANSNVHLGIIPGSSAASEAEERKRNHYSDLPSAVTFEPIATETLGGIERTSIEFIKDLAGKMKDAKVR